MANVSPQLASTFADMQFQKLKTSFWVYRLHSFFGTGAKMQASWLGEINLPMKNAYIPLADAPPSNTRQWLLFHVQKAKPKTFQQKNQF